MLKIENILSPAKNATNVARTCQTQTDVSFTGRKCQWATIENFQDFFILQTHF